MALFVSTTFSGSPDIGLQLGNEEWVRTLAIGSSWNYIRIGVLMCITGSASTSSGSPGLAIGMCSGTSLPFNNASCQNFVGVQFPGSYSYTGGASPYFSFGSGNGFACKKLGSSITNAATNLPDGMGMGVNGVGATPKRGIVFVDIIKGSPNYTIGLMMTLGGTYSGVDFTVANLIYGMTQPFANNWTCGGGQIYYGNGSQTLACDEAAGGFDTVDIYINQLNNPVNIYEIAVEKLA
jgi:hypothetical protein